MMEEAPRAHCLVYHASQDAFGPRTLEILERLGYRMVRPEDFEACAERGEGTGPDLVLVDERRLGEAASYDEGDEASVPIVLLSGKYGATGADPRIVGAVKRPAGIHDLYRLFQQVFEETPRSTPRIATQLRAHCEQGERGWEGRVLSLSENGCLMRSVEPIPLGTHIRLQLRLPHCGTVVLDAEAAYQLLPDTGLVFSAADPGDREMIEKFVERTLLAAA